MIRDPLLAEDAWRSVGEVPCLLEALVDFDRELSIVAVRGRDGSTAAYPVVENHHRDGILRLTRAPAPGLDPEVQRAAESHAFSVMDELGYVGVLAIELFQAGDSLLGNEMAPRVHNTAHWTIEGAETSQFENHLRAVCGLPLGSTAAVGVSAMVNLIGEMPEPRGRALGARRTPARLRQGTSPRSQAWSRHGARRRRGERSRSGSTQCSRSSGASCRGLRRDRR